MTILTPPPSHLLPSDGRFGVGPSRIRPAQIDALTQASELGTSHRQSPVKARVASIREGLRELFSLPPSYEIALGNGGATAFWAIATSCLIETKAKAAVFGEFGAKFAEDISAAPWATVDVTQAPPGELATIEDPGATADTYAYTQNETSTGVVSPLYRGGPSPALTLVDATSIAGASVVDWDLVDAYYFSPQKCFGSEGGLWISVLSPDAIERTQRLVADTNRYVPAILNLDEAVKASRVDQTLNTPAIATLILFDEQIKWMLDNGGLSAMEQKARAGANLIHEWAEARSFASLFVADPALRSPVTTTVDLAPEIDVYDLARTLRDVGIVDIEGYRKLGRNQLRIASFPSVETSDIGSLLACVDWMVDQATSQLSL